MAGDRPGVGLLGRRAELRELEGLLRAVQSRRSAVLVVRGEPGIGKSALVESFVHAANGVRALSAVGVESEMELPFAGLHQLCFPLLDRLPLLPEPQQHALATVFGIREGSPPDRFLVGLAALTLLCEVAEAGPVLCVIDDCHWLDRASTQALAFVARRLQADPVGLVFCTREPDEELSGLPQLVVGGVEAGDAMALLGSLPGVPLDRQVRDRIVAEAHGNPLALLEWHRALTPAEPAAGFSLSSGGPLSARLEENFRRRLAQLPAATQRFVLVAAAEPVGDATMVWRAAKDLQVGDKAALPAIDAGLVDIGTTVRFSHPLVRSAAYRLSSSAERQRVHGALADATDPEASPDRRAWHRALATSVPDEDVANELERSAGRARARGGLAAGGAFLERAVKLTPDPLRRAERALAAAQAKVQAGAFADAFGLLATAESGPLDEVGRARVDLVRAQLAFATNQGSHASALLLRAARRLQLVDAGLAGATYLDALLAALFAGRLASREVDLPAVAHAAAELVAAMPAAQAPTAADLLLKGFAANFTEGYAAGLPFLRGALTALDEPVAGAQESRLLSLAYAAAMHIWDDVRSELLSARWTKLVRDVGALSEVAFALTSRILTLVFEGELSAAALLIEEQRAATEATRSTARPNGSMALLALQGNETEAMPFIWAAMEDATGRGEGFVISSAEWATAVLNNGLGRSQEALAAAGRASDGVSELGFANWALVELVEAAVHSGAHEAAVEAYARLAGMTRASGTDWALGIDARTHALLAEGDEIEPLFREAIERLSRTRVRTELARAHLLYGEWLRRENRRVDARVHLRTAQEMLSSMGMAAFAERAHRELLASGATARKRTAEVATDLTPQETCIARLAADGLTNREIGTQLFLSARTVEWHLRHVYTKLGASSRRDLRKLIPSVESG